MFTTKTIKMKNDRTIGICISEVTSIPDVSIVQDTYASKTDVLSSYKSQLASVLADLYNQNQNRISIKKEEPLSLELLWITEKVTNQPYAANVRMFLIVRSMTSDKKSAEKNCIGAMERLSTVLEGQKYDIAPIEYIDCRLMMKNVEHEAAVSLIKEQRVEPLNYQTFESCLAFDSVPSNTLGIEQLTNVLIKNPDSAVSIQLFPTSYSEIELASLGRVVQRFNSLDHNTFFSSDSFSITKNAEKYSKLYERYESYKNQPLFQFCISVYGSSRSVSQITSGFTTMLSNAEDGTNIRLRSLALNEDSQYYTEKMYSAPWITRQKINQNNNAELFQNMPLFSALKRLSTIIPAHEASELFVLPIGGNSVDGGFRVNRNPNSFHSYTDGVIDSSDITVGRLKSSKENTIGVALNDLTKHLSVVGMPGSGKTTFSIGLLDRLWKEHHIPFLVIEPAKNEYRALIKSIPDIQIFTPGKNHISPFVINPFVPPSNVRLGTYKSTLKTAFSAAVTMTTPLDKIFEESINNCYSDHRWLDSYTAKNKGIIFNISDFIHCFQETFDEIGYTGDAKNIGRAGVVRLRSLLNLFDNYHSIPVEDLLTKPTIIELAAIENADEKALLIALLLLSILSYVNANYIGDGKLKNLILLEEAHVLMDGNSSAMSKEANPGEIARNLLKRMLAESRAYGVGIMVADQSPRKITSDVVSLTDIKVVFRLVEASDKQIISDSMDLSAVQEKRLSRLRPGEAYLYFNKLDEAEEIITPDYRSENNIEITITDEMIQKLSVYWKARPEKLRPYPECEVVPCCQQLCDYERRMLAKEISRRIFNRYFKGTVVVKDNNGERIVKVIENSKISSIRFGELLSNLNKLIVSELNDEEYSEELRACVKCQLYRKVSYETKLHYKKEDILKRISEG